ncbi:MAG: GatB/YqeY domain-containing protein, partial [bacterium]
MTPLLERLDADLKIAMKARDAATLDTLRMIKSAAKMKEIEQMKPLTDEDVQAVVKTYIKQQEDAKTNFVAGGRADLVAKAETEIALVKKYLPEQMPEVEIREIAKKKIQELGATAQDIGKVIGAVMKEVAGKADGSV